MFIWLCHSCQSSNFLQIWSLSQQNLWSHHSPNTAMPPKEIFDILVWCITSVSLCTSFISMQTLHINATYNFHFASMLTPVTSFVFNVVFLLPPHTELAHNSNSENSCKRLSTGNDLTEGFPSCWIHICNIH